MIFQLQFKYLGRTAYTYYIIGRNRLHKLFVYRCGCIGAVHIYRWDISILYFQFGRGPKNTRKFLSTTTFISITMTFISIMTTLISTTKTLISTSTTLISTMTTLISTTIALISTTTFMSTPTTLISTATPYDYSCCSWGWTSRSWSLWRRTQGSVTVGWVGQQLASLTAVQPSETKPYPRISKTPILLFQNVKKILFFIYRHVYQVETNMLGG